MICDDRAYLKCRALQELEMTLAAENQAAEDAHNELTGCYLRACSGCSEAKSAECVGCPLAFVCRTDIGTPPLPLAA